MVDSLYFTSGKRVSEISNDLMEPAKEISRGERLDVRLLTDDICFGRLYGLWLGSALEYASGLLEKTIVPEEDHPNIPSCFLLGAEEGECSAFLDDYCKGMALPVGRPHCKAVFGQAIRDEVERHMEGSPAYLRTRIAAVCILLQAMPREVFEGGSVWANKIHGLSAGRADEFEVGEGDRFILDFKSGRYGALFPRTLRNPSDTVRALNVQYQGKGYQIHMPPYGVLRAVFADTECKRMVSIKGNLTFGHAKNALIQVGAKEGISLFTYEKKDGKMELPDQGNFLDASADTEHGIVILTERELYSATGTLNKKQDLPIRCYGAGKNWARLYEDGRLESNVYQWECAAHVSAVVEDGVRGFFLYNDNGAWDCRMGKAEQISDEKFFHSMMGRFFHEGYAEFTGSRQLQLVIKQNGEVEEVSG